MSDVLIGVSSQISNELVSGTWKWKNSQSTCQPPCQTEREVDGQPVTHPFDQARGRTARQTDEWSVSPSDKEMDGQTFHHHLLLVRYNRHPEDRRGDNRLPVSHLVNQTWRHWPGSQTRRWREIGCHSFHHSQPNTLDQTNSLSARWTDRETGRSPLGARHWVRPLG